jgi:hypothetical protein
MRETTRVDEARGWRSLRVPRQGFGLGLVLLAALAPAPTARAGSVTLLPSALGTYQNISMFGPPAIVSHFNILPITFSTAGVTDDEVIYSLGFIPQGTSITSARLLLDVNGTQQVELTKPVLTVNTYAETSGNVEVSDFSQTPTLVSNITSLPGNLPFGSTPIPVTLDVTTLIQGLVNGGQSFAGFQFVVGELSAQGSFSILDSTLTLTSPASLTPEPSSIITMGLGLAVPLLAVVRRHRHRFRQSRQGE